MFLNIRTFNDIFVCIEGYMYHLPLHFSTSQFDILIKVLKNQNEHAYFSFYMCVYDAQM